MTVIPGYPTALTFFIFDSFTNLSSDLIMNSVTSLSVSLNNFLLAGFCLHFTIMSFRDCLIGYDLKSFTLLVLPKLQSDISSESRLVPHYPI